ncbi:MAG: hypothetical protein EOP61_09330 [Sphingomonadales bacterium]|nr:MAG: hypothetical protein EOP61_09330 [Sphingomonadales bacterium]
MRNAMICASFMLAIFLAWPFVFGNDAKVMPSAVEARDAVKAAVAVVPAVHVIPEAVAAPAPAVQAKPESCYKRFQREVKQCREGNSSAACKLGAADHWDMCEATGFWPS